MFTSKGIFLLVIVIILLAISWNTDITMVYIFFVIAFVMFILSFVHLQFNTPDVKIERTCHEIAYEDDIVKVNMTLENKRQLPSYFFEILDKFEGAKKGEEESSIFILNMNAREKKSFNYTIDCYKRGLWKLGPIKVISQDALGFFRMVKKINLFQEILVYPSLFRVFSFPPLASGSVSWMGVETAKISGDSHEFFGVREYQRGDSMSRIHWPSTAKHSRLIVKQFERNAVQEVTIVMDLRKGYDIGIGKETTLEYAVKIAGSISRYLLNESVLVQFVGYGKDAAMIPFGKGDSHFYKILEYLARVRADGTATLAATLEEVSFVTPNNSTLVTIMLDNDLDALTELVQFRVKGVKLIIIVLATSTFGHIKEGEFLDVEAAKRFEEALASLEAYVYRIAKGDDLEKKFEVV